MLYFGGYTAKTKHSYGSMRLRNDVKYELNPCIFYNFYSSYIVYYKYVY